jgi:hypothetical protein
MTMVKHQRRSHQNLTRSEFDDETSESDSDESLSDPQYSAPIMRPENNPQHSVMADKRQVYSFPGCGRRQNTFLSQNRPSYVPEQNNPHVTTLNTDLPSMQSPHQQLSQEILLSSPSSYSSASPLPQEAAYNLLPVQVATRAIQSQHPLLIEQQPTVYQQQMPLILGQQHLHSTPQALAQPFHFQDWSKGFYTFPDQWPQKIESFGPLLQMPSARIESL